MDIKLMSPVPVVWTQVHHQQAEQKRRERLENESETLKNKYSAKDEADLKKAKQELDKLRQELKGEIW